MEQQNIAYFSPEIDHGQSNGDSHDQFHSNQVEYSNQNFNVSNERNYHSGNATRRNYMSSTNVC
jgi:hypothetical protein